MGAAARGVGNDRASGIITLNPKRWGLGYVMLQSPSVIRSH